MYFPVEASLKKHTQKNKRTRTETPKKTKPWGKCFSQSFPRVYWFFVPFFWFCFLLFVLCMFFFVSVSFQINVKNVDNVLVVASFVLWRFPFEFWALVAFLVLLQTLHDSFPPHHPVCFSWGCSSEIHQPKSQATNSLQKYLLGMNRQSKSHVTSCWRALSDTSYTNVTWRNPN